MLLALTRDFVSFVVVFVGVLALGMSAGVHHPFMAIINQWFVRRRATAITLGLVGSELGGAVITPLIAMVVYNLSWRHAAVLSGILFPLVLIPLTFFLRNNPESMGLQRDGDPPHKPLSAATASAATIGPPPAAVREDFTVREALHTAAFWHLAMAMGLRMFSKLALQVHMVPLMVWKGIDEPTAALLVGLSALAQLPFRIAGGWLGDRWSLNRVASVACLAGIAAALSLIFGPVGSVWTGAAFVLLFAMAESGNLSGWSLHRPFLRPRPFRHAPRHPVHGVQPHCAALAYLCRLGLRPHPLLHLCPGPLRLLLRRLLPPVLVHPASQNTLR